MTTAIIVVLAYGVLCMAGGVIGYVKARSTISLLAGLGSGLLLLGFAYGMRDGSRGAAIGSAIVAGLLGARFLMTWLKKRRVMPDLIMVLASAVALAVIAPLVWADEAPEPAARQEVLEGAGQLRQMNLNAEVPHLVINSVRGGTLTFEIPPIVKVAWGVDGKPVWLDDVKRGQLMRIKYIVKDGRLRAKRINLLPKPSEAPKGNAPKPQGASAIEFPKAPDVPPAPSMGEAMGGNEAPSTPPAMEIPSAPDTNPYE